MKLLDTARLPTLGELRILRALHHGADHEANPPNHLVGEILEDELCAQGRAEDVTDAVTRAWLKKLVGRGLVIQRERVVGAESAQSYRLSDLGFAIYGAYMALTEALSPTKPPE